MIHQLISSLRKNANLSQEELAEKLGMSRQTLISLEKGERPITVEELRSLAQIFEVPIEVMLDEEVTMTKKIENSAFGIKNPSNKFRNLLLQCIKYGRGDDGKIPKTKLAKLIYLCDFASYYYTLEPISGFNYIRYQKGPVTTEFFELIDSDEAIGIEEKTSRKSPNSKTYLIYLKEDPSDEILSEEELKLVQAICIKWKKFSTDEIVEFTHNQIPWKVCRDREIIPYQLINNEEPENVY